MYSIDLETYFHHEAVKKAFYKLKHSKEDQFNHTVSISIGADGIDYKDFDRTYAKAILTEGEASCWHI